MEEVTVELKERENSVCESCRSRPAVHVTAREEIEAGTVSHTMRLCTTCLTDLVAQALRLGVKGFVGDPRKPPGANRPHRIWVRLAGTEVGMPIDNDPALSDEAMRKLAVSRVESMLPCWPSRLSFIIFNCIRLVEGCYVIGDAAQPAEWGKE